MLRLQGLVGSSAAWLLAQGMSDREGPILWVCPDSVSAVQVAEELRLFAPEGCQVLDYPQWDVDPYKGYSPSAEVCRAQLQARYLLASGEHPVLVAPVRALLQKMVPAERLLERCERIVVGTELDRSALITALIERGYLSAERCIEPGTLAMRGGVLDVFTPGREMPVRIELWGDEVDSIRSFDPYTQRSIDALEEVVLLPARDLVLDEPALVRLPTRLKELAEARELPGRMRIRLQEELAENRVLQELELFVPLLEDSLVDIFSHIGPQGTLVWQQPERIAAELFGEAQRRRGIWEREDGHSRLLPDPDELFLHEDELPGLLAKHRRIVLSGLYETDGDSAASQGAEAESEALLERLDAGADIEADLAVHEAPTRAFDVGHHDALRADLLATKEDAGGMLKPLETRIQQWCAKGARCVIVSPTRGQAEQLTGLLQPYGSDLVELENKAGSGSFDRALESPGTAPVLVRGDLQRGFVWPEQALVVLAVAEVLGRRRSASKPRRPRGHEAIGSLRQLQLDDLIVHSIHCIGHVGDIAEFLQSRLEAVGQAL